MTSVREVTGDLLRAFGLTTISGNPGTTEVPFLRDWPADLRYVLRLAGICSRRDGRRIRAGIRPCRAGEPALRRWSRARARPRFHRVPQPDSDDRSRRSTIRSLLPGEPFPGATDAAIFPNPHVKWSTEPARTTGDALKGLVATLDVGKHPAIVVGPAIDFVNPDERSIAIALSPSDLVPVLGALAFIHHAYRGPSVQPLPELFLISGDEDVLVAHSGRSGRCEAVKQSLVDDRPTLLPVPVVDPKVTLY